MDSAYEISEFKHSTVSQHLLRLPCRQYGVAVGLFCLLVRCCSALHVVVLGVPARLEETGLVSLVVFWTKEHVTAFVMVSSTFLMGELS